MDDRTPIFGINKKKQPIQIRKSNKTEKNNKAS